MLKKLHICLLLIAYCLTGQAQTYPVTISTQLTQPSPIYLSNYANTASINSPIKVQLILNDLNIMNRQVRLKCYFQGAVSFVTNDFVVGAAPIYLEGGFPTQLTNVELGSYFEYQNIKGINPNQYGQPLPEGIYTISFEVYDFATNKKLSKKSSVTTVIFQNEPPFLNLPANQAGIMEQNIQNIIFSWTPRSINVSNVEYDFSLVEIWNSNTPIQNAFAYSPPLHTTTTRNTTVQYSIAEPQLIPGKTYAWRVKARALLGAEEIGVFKNNGYSETYSFKYLTFCKPPLAITTTDVSQEQAKVTWSGAVDNYDYQVNYREKNADSKWYKLVTPREYILISNLKPKTTYEYTVGAACDPSEYTHGNIQEFTTLAQDEIAFTGCGIKPDPTALSNKTPLPALFPNDVVTAGDFPIVVLKSTGSNGTFSGEGYVTFPFLVKFRELIDAAAALAGSDDNGDSKANIGKYTRIRITFNNIGVNTDFKLISGEIVASYDPNWGSMVDGDKAVNDLLGDNGKVIPIDVQFEIKSVEKNADGTLTITGTNGVVVTQPKTDNDIIITDRNGKQYAVSPSAPVGNIESTGKIAPDGVPTPQNTNGMGSGGNIKEISSPDVSITFADGTGYYSLDENPNQDSKLKDNSKLNSTYDVIPKKDGTKYYVNYKAISDAPKSEDFITAKATFSNGKTAADVVFKTENGTEIPSTWSGNVATLTLKRTLDFAKESILATVKPPVQKDSVKVTTKYDIAGTLNMWHVTGKKVNVTLVGLNGGQTPTQSQAQEYLNSIYGKAGIQFEVNTIKIDIAQSWGTSIETGDSDLLNTYTNGQQKITTDFQTQLGASYKTDTYYVFFTGVPASKSDVLGFMPLKRQFGFVFTQSDDKKLRTLAHELGHGIFGLQHPFTNYNTSVATDLLMDYGIGTALNHNDWEIMHAPGLQLYQFTQGSSNGELRYNDGIDLLGNIISKVDIDENKTKTVLVGTLSKNATYLRVGYNEYSKTDEKLLHKYKGEIKDNKVVYIEESTQKEMPYAITLIEKGSPIIGELGGGCTYNKSIISDWTKPTNYTTEQVISEIRAKIEKQKLKWESVSLYKNDPSCAMTNTLFALIENDKENTCPPNIIATDVKKLNDLFSKTSYTDDEVVNLLVNQKVCLEALRQMSWERLSKAFKQLGTSESIKEAKETALLRLMAAIKAEKYKDFIVLLEGNGNLLTRNLLAKVNNKSINPFDGNNFTSLMKGFIFIFNQVAKPKIASGTSFDAINIVQNSYLFPDNKENLFNVQFKDDQLNINQGVWNIETDCHWVAEIGGDGREECITTKQEIIWDTPIVASPFQPISLAKESDFSLISGVSSSDIKIPVLPAIALYYAYNEGEIKNINEYVRNSLDVVTLMVPVSKIATSAGWLSKSWAFVDKWNKVNAGINLAVNNSPLKNVPELASVLETYNNVTAVLNLTTLAGGITKATVSKFLQATEKRAAKQSLLQAAKNGDKDAQMILDIEREIKQYGTKKFGIDWWKGVISGEKFIPKTGDELKTFLNGLNDLPKGVTHEGDLIRSLTIESQTKYFAVADKMTDYTIHSSWGRYDLDKVENAMYLSKTIDGNKTEVLHYVADWKQWNTYEFKNIKVDNLLDLTDETVRLKLGVQYEDLVRDVVIADANLAKSENYEMTNVLASWARTNGYNGIIAPGARGAKDYQNVIIFEQSYVDKILKGKTIEKLKK